MEASENFHPVEMSEGEFSEQYEQLRLLGIGGFGRVYLVRSLDGKKQVAKFILKEMVSKWGSGPDGQKWPQEVCMLHRLRKEKGVATIRDVQDNNRYFQIVMDRNGKCEKDLGKLIREDVSDGVSEHLAAAIFRQVVETVGRLHKRYGILHRDIKPSNILVNENFEVKLIDFGSAVYVSGEWKPFTATPGYCSPEACVCKGKYTAKGSGFEAEVWALGVSLFYTVFKVKPFKTEDDVMNSPLSFPEGKVASNELKHLLGRMLDKSYLRRATISEVLNSDWMRSYACSSLN